MRGLHVKIKQRVSEGVYSAFGTVCCLTATKQELTGPAEVLLKEVAPGKLSLHLEGALMVSKLMGKEVEKYINSQPVQVDAVKEGTEVSFNQLWFVNKKTAQ
jgi:hypothetical protein